MKKFKSFLHPNEEVKQKKHEVFKYELPMT